MRDLRFLLLLVSPSSPSDASENSDATSLSSPLSLNVSSAKRVTGLRARVEVLEPRLGFDASVLKSILGFFVADGFLLATTGVATSETTEKIEALAGA